MTNFIIHIGDGKCGSSSIQKALYARRTDLKKQGFVYETSAPSGNHFGLVTLAGRPTRGNSKTQKVLAKKTIKLIKKACRKEDIVVLSAESFFDLTPKETTKILSHITRKVDALDIIAYVRPPHSQYLSLVHQTLNGNENFQRPDKYRRALVASLKRWKDDPRVRNLVVRKFERNSLSKRDVVQDFAGVMSDLSGKPIKLETVETNISLSAEQLVVLQRFRREILGEHNGKLHPDSANLINFFQSMNKISLMGNKTILVRSALAAVCEGNAQEVATLNQMFPDLNMEIPEFETDVAGDDSWRNSRDVSSILSTVDTDDVERLVSLIPQFSPGLSKGMTSEAQSSLQRFLSQDQVARASQVNLVRQFWNRLNCGQAIADLEK